MPSSNGQVRPEVVAVRQDGALAARPRLFAALEAAYPVTFRPLQAATSPAAIIEFSPTASDPVPPDPAFAPLPRIVFSDHAAAGCVRADVRLQSCTSVDRRLHGIALGEQLLVDTLPLDGQEELLAVDRAGVRWTRSRGDPTVSRVAAVLPELATGQVLRDLLMSAHSLSVVAINHFLRALCADSTFTEPPLRASFVFDDPNVRWRSYGFIDYRRLVRHADAHGYHAVMAMVPLDASAAHGPTVSLFRRRADRLSLAIHGNDHVKHELMGPSDDSVARSMCAQALRRVAGFEFRTGLPVDRVMIPPHSMCSKNVTSALAALGFDALCAIHPEPWTDAPRDDHFLAGWELATFAGPAAVIPRFPLYCSQTEIALRAFMGNPLVLYGHHEDLASGLDLLEQAATRVNSLGDVHWMSLGALSRSNVALAGEDTLAIRPFSGRVRVRVPDRTQTIVVHEPRYSSGTLAGWSQRAGKPVAFGAPFASQDQEEIEIRLRARTEVDPSAVPAPEWRPWAALRRASTEARDRAMPFGLLRAGLRAPQ